MALEHTEGPRREDANRIMAVNSVERKLTLMIFSATLAIGGKG
jgi:hypothetical protein